MTYPCDLTVWMRPKAYRSRRVAKASRVVSRPQSLQAAGYDPSGVKGPPIGSQWVGPGGWFEVESDPIWSPALSLWFVWGTLRPFSSAKRSRVTVSHCADFAHLKRVA